MELLARILRPLHGDDALHRLINQVVVRSYDRVRERIYPSVMEMSPAEARGYIRARGRHIVQREAEIALSHSSSLAATQRDQAMTLALAALINRFSDELCAQPVSLHYERRAA